MELYDKAYFAALKERIKELDKRPAFAGLFYLKNFEYATCVSIGKAEYD